MQFVVASKISGLWTELLFGVPFYVSSCGCRSTIGGTTMSILGPYPPQKPVRRTSYAHALFVGLGGIVLDLAVLAIFESYAEGTLPGS